MARCDERGADEQLESGGTESSAKATQISGSRWFSRSILAFGLASLFSDAGHEMATAVLPMFLVSVGGSAPRRIPLGPFQLTREGAGNAPPGGGTPNGARSE